MLLGRAHGTSGALTVTVTRCFRHTLEAARLSGTLEHGDKKLRPRDTGRAGPHLRAPALCHLWKSAGASVGLPSRGSLRAVQAAANGSHPSRGAPPRTGGARGLLGEAFPPLPLTLYFPTARLTGGSGAIGSFPSSGRTAPPAPLFWGSAVPEHAHASSTAYDFISSLLKPCLVF